MFSTTETHVNVDKLFIKIAVVALISAVASMAATVPTEVSADTPTETIVVNPDPQEIEAGWHEGVTELQVSEIFLPLLASLTVPEETLQNSISNSEDLLEIAQTHSVSNYTDDDTLEEQCQQNNTTVINEEHRGLNFVVSSLFESPHDHIPCDVYIKMAGIRSCESHNDYTAVNPDENTEYHPFQNEDYFDVIDGVVQDNFGNRYPHAKKRRNNEWSVVGSFGAFQFSEITWNWAKHELFASKFRDF